MASEGASVKVGPIEIKVESGTLASTMVKCGISETLVNTDRFEGRDWLVVASEVQRGPPEASWEGLLVPGGSFSEVYRGSGACRERLVKYGF